ncbi:MAG TPA: hypothetical protein VGS22_03370 [Thermoanaerobaculia bacterium]|jgi:hypothetical protein|nr:hypothetical protein [Thermoanaerobaculia bacterium]
MFTHKTAIAVLALSVSFTSGPAGSVAFAAAPAKAGPPFSLSSCSDCQQREPKVAVAPAGDFVAAWTGEGNEGLAGVPGRSFKADGTAVGSDFAFVGSDSSAAKDVDLAASRNDVVAVWAENDRIYAQRLGFAGDRIGSPIQVSIDDAGGLSISRHLKPAVARAADGSFVVAWVRFVLGTGSGNPEILVRRFDAQGLPKTGQVKINSGFANDSRPDLCIDTANRTIAVWSNVDTFEPFLSTKKGVSARRLGPNLAPLEAERVIAPPRARESTAAISCGKGSTYVIVWETDQNPATDRGDLLARRFSRIGRPLGTSVVNGAQDGIQRHPTVAYEPSGAYTVAWTSDGDGNADADAGIVARRFSAAGVPLSGDFLVAAGTDRHLGLPAIAYAGNGSAVIVWQNSLTGVFGQRFSPAQ